MATRRSCRPALRHAEPSFRHPQARHWQVECEHCGATTTETWRLREHGMLGPPSARKSRPCSGGARRSPRSPDARESGTGRGLRAYSSRAVEGRIAPERLVLHLQRNRLAQGTKIHRAGRAFVHHPGELSALDPCESPPTTYLDDFNLTASRARREGEAI